MSRASASPPRQVALEARRERSRESSPRRPSARWESPAFEVIPLDCEISAYAPAGDEPLF